MKQKPRLGKSKHKTAPTGYAPLAEPMLQKPCLHQDLRRYLGYCFYKLAIALRTKVDQRYAPLGLVAPQFGMLIILEKSGPLTQNELGQSMVIDKATMVRLIDILEEKKLLTRTQSKTDRRANYLEITKAGRAMLEKLDHQRKEAEAEFLAPLSASERQQLTAIVDKLADHLMG
jgi:DNA-binding MarR family transcriptional regulator